MSIENQNSKELINLTPYLKLSLKYWYVFFIACFICGGIGAVYYLKAKRTYNILANIMIKEQTSSPIMGMQAAMMKSIPFGDMLGGSTSLNDEVQILGSFSVYKDVVSLLDLNEFYELKKFPFNKKYYKDAPVKLVSVEDIADTLSVYIKFKLDINKDGAGVVKAYKGLFNKEIGIAHFEKLPASITTMYGTFSIIPTSFFEKNKDYNIKMAFTGYEDAGQALQENIELDVVSKKANVINLSVLEKDVCRGKDVLNSLISVYNDKGIANRHDKADKTIQFLDDRLTVIGQELMDLEKEIEIYKSNNDIVDLEAEITAIFAASSEFKKQLLETKTQCEIVKWVEEFVSDPKNQYALIPLNIGLSDKTVLEGLQQYNNLLLERVKLQRNTLDVNPTIEQYNQQLEIMRSNLLITINNLKKGLEFARKDLQNQEDLFDKKLKEIPRQEREFVDIKRKQLMKQELYVFLLQKKEENILSVALPNPKAEVIDMAYVQTKAVAPNLKVVFAISMFMGLILSLAFIAFREKCLSKVKE